MEMWLQFFNDTFLPHGYCFQFRPDILWLNVISDFIIAVSYFTIPLGLLIFLRKRQDLQLRYLFSLFAAFILLCGLTHLFSIYVIWHASYAAHGLMKALTALVSAATAIVLFLNLDRALKIPTFEQFEAALLETARHKASLEQIALKSKAESIFKFATDLIPTGLLVIDSHQKIVVANPTLNRLFGYAQHELVGKDLACLLQGDAEHHRVLVHKFMAHPMQDYEMAAGRVVIGRHKSGSNVEVQINLSVHEYEGEQHTFATVQDVTAFNEQSRKFDALAARLKRAVNASNDGIWEWNLKTDTVWYSERFIEMTGGTPGALERDLNYWRRHVHPQDWDRVKAAIERHLRNREKLDVTYRGIGESGGYEWFHTRGDTLLDDQGEPYLMSGTLTNIHRMHILEEKLEAQSRFLDQVLQRSLTGLYIFNLASRTFTYVNEEYTRLSGYTLDQLQAMSPQFEDLYHPDDRTLIRQHMDKVCDQVHHTLGLGMEYRFRHRGGAWRWLYSRDSVYSFDEKGRPLEVLGACFDITELKQREAEIRRLALEYSMTFEQAGVGIAHVDAEGRFIKVNSKLCEILRCDPKALMWVNFSSITKPDEFSDLWQRFQQVLAGDLAVFETEQVFICHDGHNIWGHLTVSPVKSADSNNPYFIVIIENISQRKKIENLLSESNAALERFAYAASHDLQEPLRKISAFSGALQTRLQGKLDDPEAEFQLGRICDASARMSEMISKLLQLSRTSSAKLDISLHALSQLLSQVIDDLSGKLRDIDVQIRLVRDLSIPVDSSAFNQVLRNLVSNSLNYRMPDRPLVIEIDAIRKGDWIEVRLSDNGRGFDQSKAQLIFEPFRRLVGREVPGTGMGLAICQQLVHAHGGTIQAEGTQDVGAVFVIQLPALADSD